MPKLSGVIDIKPQNEAVKDIYPRNEGVIDIKPSLLDRGAGLQGETTVSAIRVIAAGQYMGLPFLLTYRDAGTIEVWENL